MSFPIAYLTTWLSLLHTEASQNEDARNSLRGISKPLKVSLMSPSQREEFEQNLKSAEEVACTLVYEEGWSLLRPKKQVRIWNAAVRRFYSVCNLEDAATLL